MTKKASLTLLGVVLTLSLFRVAHSANAGSSYEDQYNTLYGTNVGCSFCHTNPPSLNATGKKFMNSHYDYASIAPVPKVTAFNIPATSKTLKVSITAFKATDNIPITGYMATETSAPPSASATGWSKTPPRTYTFASEGVRALYAWVEDSAGIVSPSLSVSTIVDTSKPVVATFSLSSPSTSLTVSITNFTATDDVQVTGYMVTTSPITPSAKSLKWSPTPPTSFTFPSTTKSGAKKLYAWAKNATGNVSKSLSAQVTLKLAAGAAYPLKVSSNGRYLVDQNDVPFLIVGDAPQSLIVNLTEAQAEQYFADRSAHGFNAVWINLLCDTYTAGRSDGSTYDGIVPFTTPGDLSTPNPAYFARVDYMIRLAAQYGVVVFLDPIETGGWLGVLESNGATKDFNYGSYLGNRYRNFPNIVWFNGNDFQTWTSSTDDAVVLAVAQGIKAEDPVHIQTIELNYDASSSLDDSNWASIISLNAAYTYYPTYAEVLHAYNQSSSIPVFMVEANYEFEDNTGLDYGDAATLRRQEYWTMLSGATGQLYGNHYTWTFVTGWQSYLDTPGVTQLGYMKTLFSSYPWYDLIPDQNHTIVTGGYGTFSSTGSLGSNDYLTDASTPDGMLVIAYLPTVRTITINMSTLASAMTAQWYDPTNNTYTTISGSPFVNSGSLQFTPPGNNSAGDGDWVLLLQASQ